MVRKIPESLKPMVQSQGKKLVSAIQDQIISRSGGVDKHRSGFSFSLPSGSQFAPTPEEIAESRERVWTAMTANKIKEIDPEADVTGKSYEELRAMLKNYESARSNRETAG